MTREELKKMAMRYAHDELKDNHASVDKIVQQHSSMELTMPAPPKEGGEQ